MRPANRHTFPRTGGPPTVTVYVTTKKERIVPW